MVTFEQIKQNEAIRLYIRRADDSLAAMGYTDHAFGHVEKCADLARDILLKLGYDQRTAELAQIACYMHDIGNVVNRADHAQSGALMAFRILDNMGMPAHEIADIVTAVGNHDEGTGFPVNAVTAALMLVDKSDVHRSRVRNQDHSTFDIHDRVNYAVEHSSLTLYPEEKNIVLKLKIDSSISAVMDYFEIFLTRMMLCRRAANYFGLKFGLIINGVDLL